MAAGECLQPNARPETNRPRFAEAAMRVTDKGLVLKQVKLREADQILTLLTPQHGVVSASARGSLRPKSKLFSASGLYCFSEWTLFEGKNMFTVDEATPIEVFFGLRQSLEALSLAAYITELLRIYSPTGQEAADLLRLALNSLYLLGEQKRTPTLVKAVFELRSLCEAGFAPDVAACRECGREAGEVFHLDVRGGTLLCGACVAKRGEEPNLNAAALAAMRHIVYGAGADVYAFSLRGESLQMLCRTSEQFLLCHLDYPPKTLVFLKTVLP